MTTHFRYPRGATAVTVFSDGTGRARWPSGGLAVSVDRDKHGGFRLQASYKSGGSGTAVTFDSRGVGSINFPGGATMLCVHGSGSGMIMSGKGQGTGQGKGSRVGTGTGAGAGTGAGIGTGAGKGVNQKGPGRGQQVLRTWDETRVDILNGQGCRVPLDFNDDTTYTDTQSNGTGVTSGGTLGDAKGDGGDGGGRDGGRDGGGGGGGHDGGGGRDAGGGSFGRSLVVRLDDGLAVRFRLLPHDGHGGAYSECSVLFRCNKVRLIWRVWVYSHIFQRCL